MAKKATHHLRLIFHGDDFPQGQVPVSLVADKLQALQDLLYHAAATILEDERERRGRWYTPYADITSLTLAQSQIGEGTIDVEVAGADSSARSQPKVASAAVALIFQFAEQIQQADNGFDRGHWNRNEQRYLFRALQKLCPSATEPYTLELLEVVPSHARKSLFDAQLQARLRDALSEFKPIRINQISHEECVYKFSQPLLVTVDYEDATWIYHNETINLWGIGKEREEALHDLHANFDYLIREIAQEQDDVLDAKAKRIKQELIALVKEPSLRNPPCPERPVS